MASGAADESRDAGREVPSTSGPNDGERFAVESLWQAIGQLPERDEADPLLGRSLGDVTLTRFIAEGGMGRVYEAEQLNPSRRVAVKVLRPGLFKRDTLRRFVREVSTLGSLRHPWITQVFSAGTYEVAGAELPYFVMELISDALPITEYVTSRHLPVMERLRLFRQVCDAIAYGHERGIVHRDLKPSNLLVDGLGHPKVIDFGVARGPGVGARVTALTEVGQVIGTLQYMSPEQVSGQSGDVDARADVYSLGAVLYEVLAGQTPHLVRGVPLAQAARIIHEQRPRPIRVINPAVPREVAAIVEKCLNKQREARFQTAGELSAALADAETDTAGAQSIFKECRRIGAPLRRPVVAGVASAGLILCGIYLMPALQWPSFERFGWNKPVPSAVGVASRAVAIRPPNVEAVADPATALMLQPALIQRDERVFRFALRDVHQKDADMFLVKNVGMKKWMDQFMFPRVSYWAPEANNEVGMLVYRFDFGGVAESVHMKAATSCWDFFREPGGVGRGTSSIEVSRDGRDWVALGDNFEPRQWGISIAIDKPLPDTLCDSTELWVRVRCFTESAPVENGYNVAQFARTRNGQPDAVFEVTAKLREKASKSAL